jgi:hypothetical protein
VLRVRTAVHAEVVRALQRLTALPLSGALAQGAKKTTGTSDSTSTSPKSCGKNGASRCSAQQSGLSQVYTESPLARRGDNETGADAQRSDAASPTKRKRPVPRKGESRKPETGENEQEHSTDAETAGERQAAHDETTPAVVFMDNSSARAHADSITSHTYKAFQRVEFSAERFCAE